MSNSSSIYMRAVNQVDQVDTFYLHLNVQQQLPMELGTGRNAVVFLATTTPQPESAATQYRAIKFLRDNIDKQYARASAMRFFVEADKVQRFHQYQGTFVNYFGWGAIGKPDKADEKGVFRDFWWQDQFSAYHEDLLDNNEQNNNLQTWLRSYYYLQGPFYVLDLCQGTLYDLLDKNTRWINLPAYSISSFRNDLLRQSSNDREHIEAIQQTYLRHHPANRSGYDILNDFHDNPSANRVRSRAVLEVFSQVVFTVSRLHKKTGHSDVDKEHHEPLAHRDLKPGNIFFKHDSSFSGIKILLSDLGYVTSADQITKGDATLLEGRKGIEYLAPGSQYYRAPEQAELPTEVRADIDTRVYQDLWIGRPGMQPNAKVV